MGPARIEKVVDLRRLTRPHLRSIARRVPVLFLNQLLNIWRVFIRLAALFARCSVILAIVFIRNGVQGLYVLRLSHLVRLRPAVDYFIESSSIWRLLQISQVLLDVVHRSSWSSQRAQAPHLTWMTHLTSWWPWTYRMVGELSLKLFLHLIQVLDINLIFID